MLPPDLLDGCSELFRIGGLVGRVFRRYSCSNSGSSSSSSGSVSWWVTRPVTPLEPRAIHSIDVQYYRRTAIRLLGSECSVPRTCTTQKVFYTGGGEQRGTPSLPETTDVTAILHAYLSRRTFISYPRVDKSIRPPNDNTHRRRVLRAVILILATGTVSMPIHYIYRR